MPYGGIDRREGTRAAVRFSTRLKADISFTFDSTTSVGDMINHVTVHDLSDTGMAASSSGVLQVGEQVTVEVPLVGWREAEVIWIGFGRIGCRFVEPLSQAELRLAVMSNTSFRDDFPGLFDQEMPFAVKPAPLHSIDIVPAGIEFSLAVRIGGQGAEILSITPV
jgi:hypothetical protein